MTTFGKLAFFFIIYAPKTALVIVALISLSSAMVDYWPISVSIVLGAIIIYMAYNILTLKSKYGNMNFALEEGSRKTMHGITKAIEAVGAGIWYAIRCLWPFGASARNTGSTDEKVWNRLDAPEAPKEFQQVKEKPRPKEKLEEYSYLRRK